MVVNILGVDTLAPTHTRCLSLYFLPVSQAPYLIESFEYLTQDMFELT